MPQDASRLIAIAKQRYPSVYGNMDDKTVFAELQKNYGSALGDFSITEKPSSIPVVTPFYHGVRQGTGSLISGVGNIGKMVLGSNLPESMRSEESLNKTPVFSDIVSAGKYVSDTPQIKYDNEAGNFIGNTVPNALGNMVPFLAAGALTGPAAPYVTAAAFGVSGAGEGYERSIQEGRSFEEATKDAAITGGINALTGLPFIQPIAKFARPVSQALQKTVLGKIPRVLPYAGKVLTTGPEMAGLNMAQYAATEAGTGREIDPATMAHTGAMGMTLGGIMGPAHLKLERSSLKNNIKFTEDFIKSGKGSPDDIAIANKNLANLNKQLWNTRVDNMPTAEELRISGLYEKLKGLQEIRSGIKDPSLLVPIDAKISDIKIEISKLPIKTSGDVPVPAMARRQSGEAVVDPIADPTPVSADAVPVEPPSPLPNIPAITKQFGVGGPYGTHPMAQWLDNNRESNRRQGLDAKEQYQDEQRNARARVMRNAQMNVARSAIDSHLAKPMRNVPPARRESPYVNLDQWKSVAQESEANRGIQPSLDEWGRPVLDPDVVQQLQLREGDLNPEDVIRWADEQSIPDVRDIPEPMGTPANKPPFTRRPITPETKAPDWSAEEYRARQMAVRERLAPQEAANPEVVAGTTPIPNPDILTREDVANTIYNGYNRTINRNPSDIREFERINEQFVDSDKFIKMTIPVNSVGMATPVEPKNISYSSGPIIVDNNRSQVGRFEGRYGAPPDTLVLDGKHRLQEAINRGNKTIEAFVGEKAVPRIQEEINKFNIREEDARLAIEEYKKDPNGSTLSKLRVRVSPSELERIRLEVKEAKSKLKTDEMLSKPEVVAGTRESAINEILAEPTPDESQMETPLPPALPKIGEDATVAPTKAEDNSPFTSMSWDRLQKPKKKEPSPTQEPVASTEEIFGKIGESKNQLEKAIDSKKSISEYIQKLRRELKFIKPDSAQNVKERSSIYNELNGEIEDLRLAGEDVDRLHKEHDALWKSYYKAKEIENPATPPVTVVPPNIEPLAPAYISKKKVARNEFGDVIDNRSASSKAVAKAEEDNLAKLYQEKTAAPVDASASEPTPSVTAKSIPSVKKGKKGKKAVKPAVRPTEISFKKDDIHMQDGIMKSYEEIKSETGNPNVDIEDLFSRFSNKVAWKLKDDSDGIQQRLETIKKLQTDDPRIIVDESSDNPTVNFENSNTDYSKFLNKETGEIEDSPKGNWKKLVGKHSEAARKIALEELKEAQDRYPVLNEEIATLGKQYRENMNKLERWLKNGNSNNSRDYKELSKITVKQLEELQKKIKERYSLTDKHKDKLDPELVPVKVGTKEFSIAPDKRGNPRTRIKDTIHYKKPGIHFRDPAMPTPEPKGYGDELTAEYARFLDDPEGYVPPKDGELLDSKIVDSNGSPLEVFHFTDADINDFDRKYLGSNTRSNSGQSEAIKMAGLGFWFSDRDIRYSEKTKKGMFADKKISVFLNIKNPIIFDTFDKMWDESNNYDNPNEWMNSLKNDGYDGVVVKKDTELGGTSYVAFEPNQIKILKQNAAFPKEAANFDIEAAISNPSVTNMMLPRISDADITKEKIDRGEQLIRNIWKSEPEIMKRLLAAHAKLTPANPGVFKIIHSAETQAMAAGVNVAELVKNHVTDKPYEAHEMLAMKLETDRLEAHSRTLPTGSSEIRTTNDQIMDIYQVLRESISSTGRGLGMVSQLASGELSIKSKQLRLALNPDAPIAPDVPVLNPDGTPKLNPDGSPVTKTPIQDDSEANAHIDRIAKIAGKTREEILKEIASIKDPIDRIERVRQLTKPHGKEAVQAISRWYIYTNLLSALSSFAHNIVSTGIRVGENYASQPFAIAAAKASGKPASEVASWAEMGTHYLPMKAKALQYGISQGVRAGIDIMKHGMTSQHIEELGISREYFKGPVLNFISRFLGAQDIFFQNIALSEALHNMGFNDAIKKGVDMNDFRAVERHIDDFATNPEKYNQEAYNEAHELANQSVFRGKPGKIVQSIKTLKDQIDDMTIIGGTVVMPFLPTVANVAKSILEKTVFGFAMKDQRLVLNAILKNIQGKEFKGSKLNNFDGTLTRSNVEALGRTVMGISALSALGLAYKMGQIELTGPMPKDSKKREEFLALNKLAYAFRIPGVTGWMEYQYLGSVGAALAITKSAVDNLATGGDEFSVVSPIVDYAASMTDTSFLTGVSGLMRAIREPSFAPTYQAQLAGMVTPLSGLQRFIARIADPEIRDTKTFTEKYVEATPMVWPISSPKDIPPRLTVTGENVTNKDLYDLIFSKYKPDITDPVMEESVRLTNAGYPVKLSAADTNIKLPSAYKGKMNLDLTREEKLDLDRELSQVNYATRKKFVESPRYAVMNDEQKALMINRLESANTRRIEAIKKSSILRSRMPIRNLEAPPSFATTQ